MIKLKICGMQHPKNIEEIAALSPEYIGFIFYEKSPRYFNGEAPFLDASIKKTGVFVNASLQEIQEKTKAHSLNAIQLHGEESPELCQSLKAEGVEVIKVFSVKGNFDFKMLEPYEGKVDYFLFDTYGKSRGGTGKVFDWDVLKGYPFLTPFFLSGGIGESELEKIISFYQHLKSLGKEQLLYAVDVNSKFESQPGLKIPRKLKQFKQGLKRIDN